MNDSVSVDPQATSQLWEWLGAEPIEASHWQSLAVSWLQQRFDVVQVAMVDHDLGSWRATAVAGEASTLPYELLEEALEQESPQQNGNWWAAPLGGGTVFAVLAQEAWKPAEIAVWNSVAKTSAEVLSQIQNVARLRRRVERLQAVLDVAAHWQLSRDLNELLKEMAVTSTKVVRAERASIFLWDRQRKELIAHPALGADGQELRIPDDTGIVGEVIHSGEPLRVDPQESERVDRRVDIQLNFHTRSLLCVPLRDRRNKVIGAFEVLNKEGLESRFTEEDEETLIELARHASLALDQTQAYQKILQSRNRLVSELTQSTQMIGSCQAIQSLRKTLAKMADVDLNVLVLGESGTGKEVVARTLHFSGVRGDGPFVAVNSGALPENLIESELFGHEKGAFTGADSLKRGKFEQASGGTLFLDEIGELDESGQVKLLRVIEQRTVTRVGGTEEIPVDVRLIAATNKDLAFAVAEGAFREDLYYRLSVVPVTLPPLRDRGRDVLELAAHFLLEFAEKQGRSEISLSEDAKKQLLQYRWPGNIRELRNVMERVAFTVGTDQIEESDLDFGRSIDPNAGMAMNLNATLAEANRQFQIEYIKQQIEKEDGRMTEVAKKLGLHRSNLYRKMKQLGMETDGTELS